MEKFSVPGDDHTVSIPGLFDVEYRYDAKARVDILRFGDRSVDYDYDASGNLNMITTPGDKTTEFLDYDEVGRVGRIIRPDASEVRFT